ncbi:hypothetical protein BKA56DRAFT_669336 [Ilyonectria sp. MPI-CAGE-AT-0026]|nr:hypothetical protein BKA56DRAFT_669336 [Ilyonectria sp. MPI-CAGE-AT-0026]
MGGKVWTEDEERVFWEVIVPESPSGANPDHRPMNWKQCAKMMQEIMGTEARRDYTETMLYEHHYQSIKLGAKSPKASKFFARHLRDLAWYENNWGPRPPTPPPVPGKEDQELLAAIIARDPAARAYVQNKPPGQGNRQDSQDQPTLAPLRPRPQNQGPGDDERYQLPSAATFGLGASQGPYSTRSSNAVPAPPPSPIPVDYNPRRGYGRQLVWCEPNVIDPALMGGVAAGNSGFPTDHVPGLSTSASSTSTLDTAVSEGTVTRRYRPIAPAPPSYNMTRAAGPPARYVHEDVEQRHGKRQLSADDDVERSPPKRVSLSTNSGSHPTLEPRLQPPTHWQRMGFRDERPPWRATDAPATANYPLGPFPPPPNAWQRPPVNSSAPPGSIETFRTDNQYGRIRYHGDANDPNQNHEASRVRYDYSSQTPNDGTGRNNTPVRGHYERERYRQDGEGEKRA